MQIRNEIPHQLPDNTYVAIDTEWFGMKEGKLHRPHGQFAIMTICAAPDFVYYITDVSLIPIVIKNIDNCIWIMQNAKFDITQLRRFANILPRTKLIDTMLIERILWNGYYNLFGLDSMVRRYLDEERPDKDFWQKWWQEHDQLTEEAIEYSCQDASDTLRVWNEQKKILTKSDMKIWREIDMPALWAVLDFQGFRLDVEAWKQLAITNKKRVEEIDDSMPIIQASDENGNPVYRHLNPRSTKQTSDYLRKTGFKGLPSTGEKVLRRFIRKYPDTEATQIAEKILESRKYSKRASTYGENFLDNLVEHEDEIDLVYTDYHITGAETGRMSASGAMHSIPIRDTKDFRKCFIARPRHKLVIADYDAQEARITAYLTQDERLIQYFKEGKKVYVEVAKELTGQIVKKGDPEYNKVKSIFLGMDYGMTEYGLAERGIDKEYSTGFFNLFPGIKIWIDHQKESTKVTSTVSGRRAWLNPYSDQCERNALNNPHQGTAVDITKKALGYIHKIWEWNYPFGIVGVYHDEIVLDVPEDIAPMIKKVVSGCMVDAAEEICYGIPFKVDVVIADNWSEK